MRVYEATVLLVTLSLAYAEQGTVVLTADNFEEEVVQSDKLWMVKFYAPWCGHCKHLAPIYQKAAVEVGRLGLMKMGKVDATVESSLGAKYGVKGYPTLMYSRDGALNKYEGERTVPGFVAFAKRMQGEPVSYVKSKFSLSKLKMNKPVTYLLGVPPSDSSLDCSSGAGASAIIDAYGSVAYTLQAGEHFGCVDAGELVSKVKAGSDVFVARLENGEPAQFFDVASGEDVGEKALLDWVKGVSYPTVIELGRTNFYKSAHSGKHLVTLVVDPKADNGEEMGVLKRLARKHESPLDESVRSRFLYGFIDGVEHAEFVKQYGLTEEMLPRVVVFDAPNKLHFKTESTDIATELPTLLASITSGNASPKAEGLAGHFNILLKLFKQYYPYSAVAAGVGVLLVLYLFVSFIRCLCDDEDYEEEDEKLKDD